jgi:hypothetical protein
MIHCVVIVTIGLLASAPVSAQVSRIPPNAIDRSTAADDARRASISSSVAADRDRAALDARSAASRTGPLPQSTMIDRVDGATTGVQPVPSVVTPPVSPD